MDAAELHAILARGEDSRHQFKRDFSNVDSLAAELAALANGSGGQILIGVADDGQLIGLTPQDIGRINQLLSNAASQHVRPPLNPTSQNIQIEQGLVVVVDVAQGINKPYMDLQGRVWVKSGADKRHVSAREELQRMFQQSGLLQADQVPVRDVSVDDIDERAFARYFARRYGESVEQTGLPLIRVMENLELAQNDVPNLAGMLLFGKHPQRRLQVCFIAAVCFPGTVLYDNRYLDSENIDGTLEEQYQRGMAFIKRNLHHVQGEQSFNSLGQLEVPEAAFVELLVNALVHRDFFISATIRLFVFTDRVEIISPGHLPDTLTPAQIRAGQSNRRNKVLAEHAAHILPYRGLGTGIPRALQAWPKIDLIDEREANQFKAIVWRSSSVQVPPIRHGKQDRPEVTPEVTPEVMKMLHVLTRDMRRGEIMAALGLKDEKHFRAHYQQAGIGLGVIEMTQPDKPRSSKQSYRLTPAGKVLAAQQNKKEGQP